MEVLLIGKGPFHDPEVQWKARNTPDGYRLVIGSEQDRIAILCTEREIQRIIRAWLEENGDA